jgi:cytochrome c
MLTRVVKIVSLAAVGAVVAMGAANAQSRATKDEAVAMVKKAVAAVKADSAKAYDAFTKKDPAYTDRDLYIVVYKLDGTVLAHGQNADSVGKNLIGAKDPDGKEFVKERVEKAKAGAPFWQDYKFSDPLSKKVEPKEMYCEPVGDTAVCGGVYKP